MEGRRGFGGGAEGVLWTADFKGGAAVVIILEAQSTHRRRRQLVSNLACFLFLRGQIERFREQFERFFIEGPNELALMGGTGAPPSPLGAPHGDGMLRLLSSPWVLSWESTDSAS